MVRVVAFAVVELLGAVLSSVWFVAACGEDRGVTHIYVAGPMRGIPEFNFEAFDRAAAELRLDGWVVHSPAEWDREQGFSEVGCSGFEPLDELASFSHRASMGAATAFICERADAIYMLAGWESSSGARAEHALAVCLGLEVLYEASV